MDKALPAAQIERKSCEERESMSNAKSEGGDLVRYGKYAKRSRALFPSPRSAARGEGLFCRKERSRRREEAEISEKTSRPPRYLGGYPF